MPGGRRGRVDHEPHLALVGHRFERRQLERDELRLAFLAVDARLDDQDAVGGAELARLVVGLVEDDVSTLPVMSSSRRNTIASPRFVVMCRTPATMPPIVTTSPSRRRSSSATVASDLRRSWSRIPESGCSET